MKAYLAFTKKEFVENVRTYKLLIMVIVFLLFGMMNPITAKITPQLLKDFMPSGIQINIAEPTAMDSWAQFFKNVPQMGLIVLVIVFSGIMANEFSRGTLINVLTKGLSRFTVILSKFTMAVSVWTMSYLVCFAVSYGYTLYFWKDRIPNVVFSVFCLWLFGVLLIASIMLGGVVFRNSYGCLLLTGGFVALLFLINIVPKIQKYNPIMLISGNMGLLRNQSMPSDFTIPIIICCIAAVLLIASSAAIFNRKQI